MTTGSRKTRTAAERLGYRWMMRCLRAIEAQGRAAARARKEGRVGPPREARVFVKHVSRKAFGKSHRDFMKLYNPAATEAIAMLNADMALNATFMFRAPVDKLQRHVQKNHSHPLSHLIEIHVRW